MRPAWPMGVGGAGGTHRHSCTAKTTQSARHNHSDTNNNPCHNGMVCSRRVIVKHAHSPGNCRAGGWRHRRRRPCSRSSGRTSLRWPPCTACLPGRRRCSGTRCCCGSAWWSRQAGRPVRQKFRIGSAVHLGLERGGRLPPFCPANQPEAARASLPVRLTVHFSKALQKDRSSQSEVRVQGLPSATLLCMSGQTQEKVNSNAGGSVSVY